MPDFRDFADALTRFMQQAREEGQTEEQIAEKLRTMNEMLSDPQPGAQETPDPRVSPTRVG
jgi:hypothetical protein